MSAANLLNVVSVLVVCLSILLFNKASRHHKASLSIAAWFLFCALATVAVLILFGRFSPGWFGLPFSLALAAQSLKYGGNVSKLFGVFHLKKKCACPPKFNIKQEKLKKPKTARDRYGRGVSKKGKKHDSKI